MAAFSDVYVPFFLVGASQILDLLGWPPPVFFFIFPLLEALFRYITCFWELLGDCLGQLWDCFGDVWVLKLSVDCFQIVLGLFLDCFGVVRVLNLFGDCFRTTLGLFGG